MVDSNFEIDLTQFHDLYIEESQRHLLALNQGILDLEQQPGDEQIIYDIFLAAHTLKGMSATMGFETVANLAHALEDVFHQIHVGNWSVTTELISRTFIAIDTVEALVKSVAVDESTNFDITNVLMSLQQYQPGGIDNSDFPQEVPYISDVPIIRDNGSEREDALVISEPESVSYPAENKNAKTEELSSVKNALYDAEYHMVSIDVKHLDRLLDVVSEMIIHRSYLLRLQQREQHQEINTALFTHYRLLDSLQSAVLKTRMVPVRHIFNRFPRMVRDLLREQGKDAQLIIEGENVEVDRTMLTTLNDSLVHLIRNAVDHGLEPPKERQRKNKPAEGKLSLSAYYVRNSVIIEISDDGCGMDVNRIGAVAVERGIISAAELADMNQSEILELICSPGFSLSSKVTKVSGRGMGMNAVKREIELMRGSLEIETQLGFGSTFRIKLPVNLTLLDALLVRLGSEHYAIPASQIERIEEIRPEAINRVGNAILVNLEDGILPLMNLRNIADNDHNNDDFRYAIVTRRHQQAVGICVHELCGFEQIVVKPLPPVLQYTPGLSGVSILGEGQTVLILDLLNI